MYRPRKSTWPTYSATSPPAIRSTKHPGTLTATPGAGFAGGLIGGDIGDEIGSAAGGIGAAGGYLAGTRAHEAAIGLPERMVVGVSETTIYGFAGNRAHPQALVFRVPREGLEAKVHQHVNVRVLELIDTGSGSRIELEGMRLPITHSKDVIQELT